MKSVDVSSVNDVKNLLFEMDGTIPCEGFKMLIGIEKIKTKYKKFIEGGVIASNVMGYPAMQVP